MDIKKIHADIWIGLTTMSFAILFYVYSYKFYNQDAAKWPKAVIIIILVISSILIIEGINKMKAGEPTNCAGIKNIKGSLIAVFVILVYATLMNFAGYFISTAIFLPAGMYALGQKNWKTLLFVTLGLELFIYILFVVELQLRMP